MNNNKSRLRISTRIHYNTMYHTFLLADPWQLNLLQDNKNRLIEAITAYHFKTTETLQQFTIPILQPMCLVNDCNPPVNSTQLFQIRDNYFICCYQSMKLVHILNSIALKHTFHQTKVLHSKLLFVKTEKNKLRMNRIEFSSLYI